jgi:hypothetical protein
VNVGVLVDVTGIGPPLQKNAGAGALPPGVGEAKGFRRFLTRSGPAAHYALERYREEARARRAIAAVFQAPPRPPANKLARLGWGALQRAQLAHLMRRPHRKPFQTHLMR